MPHSTYLPEQMGRAEVTPAGPVEAGSYQSFTLTYTAGKFGIDDSGSIKVVHRFASDMGRPQSDDPAGANYVTVEASNGAVLHVKYDIKSNIRPWDKTLYIKVVRGFLSQGDQIIVRFGDRGGGGPGIRVQTFCEESFEFRVLVDAFATYNYVELPDQPAIEIVSGPPVLWKAILPSRRRCGEAFRLCLKGEDRWGTPSDKGNARFALKANLAVAGLPETVSFAPGEFSQVLENLSLAEPGVLTIELIAEDGAIAAVSNPLDIVEAAALLPYWGDLHGQSEETIGTNSARDFHTFARDKAFLDAVAHQGNDFQITSQFWAELNQITAEFDEPGRFIAFPGYEWSGNTGLGGDRNVLYRREGRPIFRSSHALVDDLSDLASDANSAAELFAALKDEDCVVFAHIGGRYADIKMAHDIRLERAVEVHSAWGTFEWLIEDALEKGYRVGIVSNSDGHKGRPGASHPGATKFGAYGGLTCMLAPKFSREGFLEALRRRHHYGTTGCRMILDCHADFESPAELFDDDPLLGPSGSRPVHQAMMGDILRSTEPEVTFRISVRASGPIERIELRNGLATLETFRPYEEVPDSKRIRVIWEGSEYRGRGRETIWDGSARLTGNSFTRLQPINRYNLDKPFTQNAPGHLEWGAITPGGFGGVDAWLAEPRAGSLAIETALVQTEIPVKDIGREDLVFEAGGIRRQIRVFRLPEENPHLSLEIERRIPLADDRDNALYVCITLENGHMIWSSPIYIFR